MEDFQEVISTYLLQDSGFIGPYFTWCNGKEGSDCINERLDRLLAIGEWCKIFPNSAVVHGFIV